MDATYKVLLIDHTGLNFWDQFIDREEERYYNLTPGSLENFDSFKQYTFLEDGYQPEYLLSIKDKALEKELIKELGEVKVVANYNIVDIIEQGGFIYFVSLDSNYNLKFCDFNIDSY